MSPRVLQATLLLEVGRYLEAETLLRAAIAEGGQPANVHAMLGLCLRHAGLHEAANAELKNALAIDPNCAYVHYALSFLSPPTGLRTTPGFVGTCIKHILRALELAPNEVLYLVRLAQLRQTCAQWKQSLEPIEAGLRLAPHHVGLAALRAEALIHLGQRDAAHEVLVRALASDPEASTAHAGMGWALLRTGDYDRASKFFDEALRLHPELDWAQHGALECAKYRYKSYRLLTYLSRRLVHRPLLRFGVDMAFCTFVLLAAIGLLFWLDPIVRPRWGGWLTAVLLVPLLVLPFAIQFGTEPFYSWRVRRHRSAQLSATLPHVRAMSEKWIGAIVIAGVTVLFAALLHYSKSAAVFGLLGVVPGVACIVVTLGDVPAGAERKWLMGFSVALLIAGPILMISGRKFILDLDPDPRGAALLLAPAIVIALISARLKVKQRKQEHERAIAASHRKLASE